MTVRIYHWSLYRYKRISVYIFDPLSSNGIVFWNHTHWKATVQNVIPLCVLKYLYVTQEVNIAKVCTGETACEWWGFCDGDSVMVILWWWFCDGDSVMVILWWWFCDGDSVMVILKPSEGFPVKED